MGEARKQQLMKQWEGITTKLMFEWHFAYLFVSGEGQNYKEQPLLKSVDLYLGDWRMEIVTGALCVQEGLTSFDREGWKAFM